MLQDLSQRSIETGFWQIWDATQIQAAAQILEIRPLVVNSKSIHIFIFHIVNILGKV